MGTRGRDEHHKFKFGDFELKKASNGTEFEFSRERGTKTRTGETEKSTNADGCVFKPKMWATPDRPDRCPQTQTGVVLVQKVTTWYPQG